ncbi:hypothetical protein [Erythrobacter sp. MTPC3]|uniref:hypothetical protein n=1 Tax=Erythrobacter sp. MTPC3 TaxID=3056564 RepID=UPI0036F267A7
MTFSRPRTAVMLALSALALPACAPTLASPLNQGPAFGARLGEPVRAVPAPSNRSADFTPARLFDVKLLPGPGVMCKGPGCIKRHEIARWEQSYTACQAMRFDANCRQVIELYPQAVAHLSSLKNDRGLRGPWTGKRAKE